MSRIFSDKSEKMLATCHHDLHALFTEVLKIVDCTIICGHRDQHDQEEAFRTGKSKLNWPDSKHNSFPSLAVDVVPYPIDWNDRNRFYHFAGVVRGVAAEMGIGVRWGGDWDNDFELWDQKFMDLPHFELTGI